MNQPHISTHPLSVSLPSPPETPPCVHLRPPPLGSSSMAVFFKRQQAAARRWLVMVTNDALRSHAGCGLFIFSSHFD